PAVAASDVDAAWARRWLGVSLSTTGEYANFREGLELVERNLRARPGNSEDLQATAIILASHSSHRREAFQLFEVLAGRRAILPEQQFYLGRLYEESGDWSRARTTILGLLGQEPNEPRYVAYYARNLINLGETGAARPWLDKLEQLEPGTFTVLEL